MNEQERVWHNKNSGPEGPTIAELAKLWKITGGQEGHTEEQRLGLSKELYKMRYTIDGPGCRTITNISETFENPGPNAIAPGSAKNELEAAEAAKFYPNVPWKLLQVRILQLRPSSQSSSQDYRISVLTKQSPT
jgi:hypothetical protein